MAEENILTQKVGPLPLVVWVIGGSGVVLLFLMMTHKGNNNAQSFQTNQLSTLAPTEAEAFGTIEQQQQDVTNALTTLGNNQSALGGSISTLTGVVTQQGQDNAASFQNLVNGQQSILQGQSAASSAAANYYWSLISNMQSGFGNLQGSLNSINTNVNAGTAQQAAWYQNLQNMLSGISGQVTGVSGQVGQVSSQQQADAQAQRYGFANMDALLAYMFYQMPNRYASMFPASATPSQNLASAEAPA